MNPHNQNLAKKQPLIDLRKPPLVSPLILKEGYCDGYSDCVDGV